MQGPWYRAGHASPEPREVAGLRGTIQLVSSHTLPSRSPPATSCRPLGSGDLLGCSARSAYCSYGLMSTGRTLVRLSTAARLEQDADEPVQTPKVGRVDPRVMLQMARKSDSHIAAIIVQGRSVYRAWQPVSNGMLHHGVNTSTGRTRYAHDLALARAPLTDQGTCITAVAVGFEHLLAEDRLRSAAYPVIGKFVHSCVSVYITAYKHFVLCSCAMCEHTDRTASHNDQDHLAQEGCSRFAVIIGCIRKSPSRANKLQSTSLSTPDCLLGGLICTICTRLQPHGLYHADGRLKPSCSPSSASERLPSRYRLHLPAIIVLHRVHHMCARCRARVFSHAVMLDDLALARCCRQESDSSPGDLAACWVPPYSAYRSTRATRF